MAESVNRQPEWRTQHTNQIIEDDVIIWGGYTSELPKVHSNEEKTSIISNLDILNIPLLQWDTVTTTGTPPAGAMDYSSTAISNDMYVFGGRCDGGDCCHNDLHHFNTTNKVWRAMPTTTASRPMEKYSCGLISYSYQGSDYLLTLGGRGGKQQPTQQQQHSLYIHCYGSYYTNEVHIMNITTSPGQWVSPLITGDRPPPMARFTINVLPNNRMYAIIFGGVIVTESNKNHCSNDIYYMTLADNTVNFTKSSLQSQSSSQWPKPRGYHSSTIISNDTSDHLLIIGGGDASIIADCWIINITTKKWSQINLPQSVCGRCAHSVSSIRMNTNTQWIIVTGGRGMGGSLIKRANVVMIIEIEYKNDQWMVNGVWNSINKQELIERRKRIIIPVQRPLQQQQLREIEQLRAIIGQKDTAIRAMETTIVRQAVELHDQLLAKDTTIGQKDATITEKETTIRQQEQLANKQHDQLRAKDAIIRQKDTSIRGKEAAIYQQEQRTNQQLQAKDAIIQQNDTTIREKEATIHQQEQQATQQEQRATQRLQAKDAIIRQKDTSIRGKEATIHRQEQQTVELRDQLQAKDTTIGQLRATIEQNDATIQDKNDIIERYNTTIAEQQRVIESYRDNPHWVVQRDEVTITETVLGQGGWGEVNVGMFRGSKVAVKRLYQAIQSELYMELFAREMEMASRIRHPNLLQFIGATREGELIIVTELMPTSLRNELERNQLMYVQVIAISIDIITALNYLHLIKPHPIIHRDISSANVLLQPIEKWQFKAKLSDYGSVNLQNHIKTENPGNPVYSAPESKTPAQQSPAMDIYSYGILLMEMATRRFPSVTLHDREAQIRQVKRPSIRSLINRCTVPNRNNRPTTNNVLEQLEELHKSEFN